MKKLWSTLAIATLLLAGCNDATTKKKEAKQLDKVTVMLDWLPNTNHTGLYVAKEKGFFKAEGLDVDIVQPPEGSTADALVAAGKADYGVSYQEAVTMARVNDVPVVSIGAIIQHNTSAFATYGDTKLASVKDFEGKRYGGWGSPVESAVIKAVMEKEKADFSKVKMVTLGATDFFKAIGRDADFMWIYYGWDGVQAERQGKKLQTLMVKDLDPALDYYTPVLVASETKIAKKKDEVKRFMKAVAKGYEFAIDEPKAAADVLTKVAPELDKELVAKSQEWLASQYKADAKQWGIQQESVWENYANWMFERKLIAKNIEASKAFTNEFLPQ